MTNLITIVSRLRNEEQHDSIVRLLEILIEHPESNKSTDEGLDPETVAQLQSVFSECLFAKKKFSRAKRALQQTLDCKGSFTSRRALKRIKSIGGHIPSDVECSDNETKFKISKCLLMMDNYTEALKVAEKIPVHSRSVKILAHLANLYMRDKDSVIRASETHIEILRLEPCCLNSVIKLFEIGRVSYDDVVELIPDEVKSAWPWYLTWIHAQHYLHTYELDTAVDSFEKLLSNNFPDNPSILTDCAEAFYRNRNHSEAITKFRAAFEKDPLFFERVDSYAACLFKESKVEELEELCEKVTALNSTQATHSPELWLVSAYYNFTIEMHERALLFAQKAYDISKNHVETLILLATLHLDRNEPLEANKFIFQAYKQASYRFDVRQLICKTYIARKDPETACAIAKLTLNDWNRSAKARELYADIKSESEDHEKIS